MMDINLLIRNGKVRYLKLRNHEVQKEEGASHVHNEEKIKDKKSHKIVELIKEYWLQLILLVFVLLCIIYAYEAILFYDSYFDGFFPKKPEKPEEINNYRQDFGTLGDFFGGTLNPFFSLIGLFMLLATLIQNQKELKLSRQELEESKKALQSQATTSKHQSETLEKQRFEDTFFALLEQHNSLLEKITSLSINNGENSIAEHVINKIKDILKKDESDERKRITYEFRRLHVSKEFLLSGNQEINQYFRVLYQILKFVASNCHSSTIKDKGRFSKSLLEAEKICSDDEKLYSNIVRSFLSDDICRLLLINCYCKNEDDIFIEYKLLIERYSLLEHMQDSEFSIVETGNNGSYTVYFKDDLIMEMLLHYQESAFGTNANILKARNFLIQMRRASQQNE